MINEQGRRLRFSRSMVNSLLSNVLRQDGASTPDGRSVGAKTMT